MVHCIHRIVNQSHQNQQIAYPLLWIGVQVDHIAIHLVLHGQGGVVRMMTTH